MKNSLGLFLVFALLLQQLAPTLSWAQEKEGKLANLNDYLFTRQMNSPEVQEKFQDAQKIIDLIQEKKFSELPKQIFDPAHLSGQSLYVVATKKTYPFNNIDVALPPISVDDIKVSNENGDIILKGFMNDELVAIHKIPKLNSVAIKSDEEAIVALTSEGKLISLDNAFVLLRAFKGPVPVYKLMDASDDLKRVANSGSARIDFLTRNLRPYVLSEVESHNTNVIYPKNYVGGKPVLKAGDVMISIDGEQRELVRVFSRQSVHQAFESGAMHYGALAYMFSLSGVGQTFSEYLDEQMQIETDKITNVSQDIFQLTSELNLEEDIENNMMRLTNSTLENEKNAALILRNTDREVLKTIIANSKNANTLKKRAVDEFTYPDWFLTFEAIENQYQKEQELISLKLEREKLSEGQKNKLLDNALKLRNAYESNELSQVGMNLFEDSLKGNTRYSTLPLSWWKSWYQKMSPKAMAKIALKSSLLVSAAAGLGYVGLHNDIPVLTENMLLLSNW